MPKKPAAKSIKKSIKQVKPKIAKAGPALPSNDSDGGAMGSLMPKVKR